MTTALRLAGFAQPRLPITLDPEGTRKSILALLPPAAIFHSVFHASDNQGRGLVSAASIGAAASVVLGAAQVARGDQSRLYRYDPTNVGPVGLLSSRNHQTIFVLTDLPMATSESAAALGGFILLCRSRYSAC